MPNTFRRTLRAWPAVAAATAALTIAGCSSSTDNAAQTQREYCQAWQQTLAAFGSYRSIDIVNGGLDSVRAYLDRLDSAVRTLDDTADAQVKPKVDAFKAAVRDLESTVTSTALPVDRRAQVRAAAEKVNATWNELSDAARPGCPNTTPSNDQ